MLITICKHLSKNHGRRLVASSSTGATCFDQSFGFLLRMQIRPFQGDAASASKATHPFSISSSLQVLSISSISSSFKAAAAAASSFKNASFFNLPSISFPRYCNQSSTSSLYHPNRLVFKTCIRPELLRACRTLQAKAARKRSMQTVVFSELSKVSLERRKHLRYKNFMQSKVLLHLVKAHQYYLKFQKFDVDAIKAYCGSEFFRKANNNLRGAYEYENDYDRKHVPQFIENLHRALLKPSCRQYEGLVYRGSEWQFPKLKVGGTYCDKGFLSSSTDREIAWQFANRSGLEIPPKPPTMFFIQSKTGVMVDHLSRFEEEQEVLFRDGTLFRITNIEKRIHCTEVYLEEIVSWTRFE